MKTIRKLKAYEIDVKVKQVTEKGIALLLYKTARVDMDILDEVYGAENWQSDYKEIKGNLYAGIAIKSGDEWVWKYDCGIESRADGDGNEKKGEASDAFKRAGFKWGIGRELYTAPFIWIMPDVVPVKQFNNRWVMEKAFTKFHVSEITYNELGEITDVVIKNDKGVIIYGKNKPAPKLITAEQIDTLIKLDANFIKLAEVCRVASINELTEKQACDAIKLKQEQNKGN